MARANLAGDDEPAILPVVVLAHLLERVHRLPSGHRSQPFRSSVLPPGTNHKLIRLYTGDRRGLQLIRRHERFCFLDQTDRRRRLSGWTSIFLSIQYYYYLSMNLSHRFAHPVCRAASSAADYIDRESLVTCWRHAVLVLTSRASAGVNF